MKIKLLHILIYNILLMLCIKTAGAQEPAGTVQTIPEQPPRKESEVQTPDDAPQNNGTEQEKQSLASIIFALDPLVKKGPQDKMWVYSLSGGLVQKTGNTATFNASGQTSFVYDNGITELSISYEMNYCEVDEKMNEYNGLGAIILDHYVHPRIELFLFSRGEFNSVTDLQFRSYNGAGAKFVLVRNSFWATDISLAPVYQYEKYSHLNETHEARASLRYRIKLTPVTQFKLQFTMFYIPAFDSIENYRLTIDTFAEVPIKEFSVTDKQATEETKSGLYLQVGYKRDFNNMVPEGTYKEDQKIYVNLALKI